jgi:hypothetical protein
MIDMRDNRTVLINGRPQLAILSVVLGMFGVLKLYAWAAGAVPEARDVVLGVPLSSLTLATGVAELVVAACLMGGLKPLPAAKLCTFTGFAFLGYRWLHASMGSGNESCPCLGALSGWSGFVAAHEQQLLASAALWIFLVGIWSWMKEATVKEE